LRRLPAGSAPILLVSAGLGVALLVLVWADHTATRTELLSLLRDHAGSLRHTVAAAARSNRAAGRQAEAQLAARLLDTARMLGEIDRRGGLSAALVEESVSRQGLFRASVFSPSGALEIGAGTGPAGPRGRGRGEGSGSGPGSGLGRGPGLGPGGGPGGGPGSGLLPRLLSGTEAEAVSDVHTARGRGGSRLAAGVHRASGGAIILTADATAVSELLQQTSLDALFDDIVTSAPDLAYVLFEQDGRRLLHGEAPPLDQEPPGDVAHERELTLAGRPILELAGPISVGEGAPAQLRLGMRADGIRRAEQRMLLRLALTLGVTLALSGLGVGTIWLRRKYALLSERHARAEEALRRRDRLVAMGELASTVAHEVRNPLNAIAMSAQRLEREFLADAPEAATDELRELLSVVSGESQRIDRIVRQFLEFARPPQLHRRPVDVAALVSGVAEASRALAGAHGVTIETAASRAGEAALDPDRLREALENLLRNAIEATPEGGHVALTTRGDAETLEIEVADSGSGIPAELLPRIFDLYFTTKPEGTGVGLPVTQQIVTAHEGTLEVDSRPGAGTRMILRLPRVAPEVGRG
jgi:signal transduction histidine kinase